MRDFAESEIKYGRLIHLVEEISKQSSVEVVIRLLLGTFTQIYTENQE